MNEELTKKWVKDKDNQQKVVERFFNDYQPEVGKICFFMAGIPGAGKTEFAERTIREVSPGLVPIEHDRLVEYIQDYQPEQYYNYRKAGSILVTRLLDECLRKEYRFIFDGTLSHENGVRNIAKCLKHGYKVIVVYIIQNPKKAWELTQAREILKKRAIERDGFIDTCSKINENLLNIFNEYKKNAQFNFWIIDKQGSVDFRQAKAILHGADLDSETEVEQKLKINYNVA